MKFRNRKFFINDYAGPLSLLKFLITSHSHDFGNFTRNKPVGSGTKILIS